MFQLSTIPRVVVLLAFVGQVTFAVGWLWLMPKGFGPGHVRFWTNWVWPVVMLIVCLCGLWSQARGREQVKRLCLGLLGSAAVGGAIAALLIFPDLIHSLFFFGLVLGSCELLMAFFAGLERPSPKATVLIMAAAIPYGAFLPWGLRAEAPTTRPLGESCPWDGVVTPTPFDARTETSPRLADRGRVSAYDGSTVLNFGPIRLELEPLLTFQSTSPSGGWTALSQVNHDRSPEFGRMTGAARRNEDGGVAHYFFGPRDRLRVLDRGPIELTTYATLVKPIYSHLNSFCVVRVTGYRQLQLEFSPCGEMRFEPKPADYPTGRPARFAYCDAERKFHVVEATSGEKGPFKSLGEGRLESDAPLTIGFIDAGVRIATIRFDDWSRQLSTAVSPTAGWGVAVNAIEFQEYQGSDGNAVNIWMTLAGTSVGRGWDTVGHTAGTYRNRIFVEAAQTGEPVPNVP